MNVSVAMATYMGSAYVVEQLASILEQSVPPAEIVVCDDCSSDETAQLIAEFAKNSAVPITLVVNDERLGWRGNFMKAASLCTSELIAFCDQDDLWETRKLELIVAEFEHAETLMVFHDATIVGMDLRPIRPFLQGGGEPDRAGPLERGPWRDVYGFTIAFRRELLALWTYWPSSVDKSVGDQRAAHDQWLLFLGSALGATVHMPESLAFYRQHDRNAVGVKDAFARISRRNAFFTYRDVVNLRLVVLDGRIRILRRIAQRNDRFTRAAASASVVYEEYRIRLAFQTAVYSSHSLRRRVRSLAGLLARGSYSSDVWALGRLQVLDDSVAALVGPTGVAWLGRMESRRSIAWSRLRTRVGRQSQSP